jgi:molybdopterin-containing oxidoreductase family iron-sulfur binding subunit
MTYGTRRGVNYNAVTTVEWGEYPDAHQRYVTTMCMHCDEPECVPVCPVDATHKLENGFVLIDYEECIGCGSCVDACPYNQRTLVEDQPTSYGEDNYIMPNEKESAKRLDVAEKCIFCAGFVENGAAPMCTVHCPGRARIFGDANDPNSDISKYIKEKKAVKIGGTSIYYVIPMGMKKEFLPKSVTEAIKAKNSGGI